MKEVLAEKRIAGDCWRRGTCGSGLVSRKGREAAPGFQLRSIGCWGCCAALSDRSGAPARPLPQGRALH
ncbi:hypothetical protein B8W72_25760 [Pseudomonas putida]|uniref:Uncharacterized protein n=1 Tax=Pseudomonas putida TaxID=303 RepID=A0A1Y3KNV9_PSEPU|nr:hypothetical protein B8W72_25760 [Pseudomonas putida]